MLLFQISLDIFEAAVALAFHHCIIEKRVHLFVRVDYFVEQVFDSFNFLVLGIRPGIVVVHRNILPENSIKR